MTCRVVDQAEVIPKYLNGQLDPAAQDNFEVHILECPECQDAVELFQSVREQLEASAHEIRSYQVARRNRWLSWEGPAADFDSTGASAGSNCRYRFRFIPLSNGSAASRWNRIWQSPDRRQYTGWCVGSHGKKRVRHAKATNACAHFPPSRRRAGRCANAGLFRHG